MDEALNLALKDYETPKGSSENGLATKIRGVFEKGFLSFYVDLDLDGILPYGTDG